MPDFIVVLTYFIDTWKIHKRYIQDTFNMHPMYMNSSLFTLLDTPSSPKDSLLVTNTPLLIIKFSREFRSFLTTNSQFPYCKLPVSLLLTPSSLTTNSRHLSGSLDAHFFLKSCILHVSCMYLLCIFHVSLFLRKRLYYR